MIGYGGVQGIVATALATRLPARLALLDTQLGPVLNGRSAVPAFVASGMRSADQVGLDDWPFVLTVVQGLPQLRLAEMEDDGAQVFWNRYGVRCFVWARGDGFEETDSVRARLTLAVREVLLTGVQFTTAVKLIPTTVDERYSDVGVDDTLASSVAASWVGFQVEAREVLTPRTPGAPLAAITVLGEVNPVPLDTQAQASVPHPALR